ncbi:MAG: hypothetical protein GY765_40025, partial [bacterium]|nr:hypothetical protein [bacterium]
MTISNHKDVYKERINQCDAAIGALRKKSHVFSIIKLVIVAVVLVLLFLYKLTPLNFGACVILFVAG